MTRDPKPQKKIGPQPGTSMDLICEALYDNPMTEQEIYASVGLVYANNTAQRKALARCVNADWLTDRLGKYSLNPWLAEIIATRHAEKPTQDQEQGAEQEPQPVVITPPVYHPPFKPLRDMYAGVREKVRDASFVTCSGVPSKVWGGV